MNNQKPDQIIRNDDISREHQRLHDGANGLQGGMLAKLARESAKDLKTGCAPVTWDESAGHGGGGNSGDCVGTLTWPSGEPVWAPPLQPGETISLTVGGERPPYPSTGNISSMALMGEVTRTFETTATSGYLQATRDGEPITLTLRASWVDRLLEGQGAKRASYADHLEKTWFFSRDEDRDRLRAWDYSRLDEATVCTQDFVAGDLDELLAEKWVYLRWLLSGDTPVCFLDHPHRRTDDGDDAETTIHQYDQRITVRWQTTKPHRYDKRDLVIPVNVFCWEMPQERFKVYIDGQFNVIYSFAFEEQNVFSTLLQDQVPVGFIAALETFMALYPMPVIHNYTV